MRKLSYMFLGALIGIALTIGGGAFAASTGLVGKKIVSEVPIVFNGEQIPDRGSVAGGTTLLPVRSLAGLFGATTEYKDGKVYLNKVGDSDMPDTPTPTPVPTEPSQLTAEQIQTQITDLNNRISKLKDEISGIQEFLDSKPVDGNLKDFMTKNLSDDNELLSQLQQQKADLEAQLKALQGQ